MNIQSNRLDGAELRRSERYRATTERALPRMIWQLWATPRASMLPRKTRNAADDFSMKHASRAPREIASRPRVPAPANASRTLTWGAGGPMMLKMASRTRSEVGRGVAPDGALIRLPPKRPPMIRMVRQL